MTWNDDSWRDSYDAWKLQSPDDEYPEQDWEHNGCDHENCEINIIDGRAWCDQCGEVWHASEEEIARQIRHEAEYHEWEQRQQRREFWRKLTLPVRWPIFRLLEKIWPRQAGRVLDDGELPF